MRWVFWWSAILITYTYVGCMAWLWLPAWYFANFAAGQKTSGADEISDTHVETDDQS